MAKQLPYYQIPETYKDIGTFLGKTFKEDIQKSIEKKRFETPNYSSYLPNSQVCLGIRKKYFSNSFTFEY